MNTLTLIDRRSSYRDQGLPNVLYRRFNDRKHAEYFMSGNIIFRSLQYYRDLAKKGDIIHGDSSEGSVIYAKKLKAEIQKGGDYFSLGDFNSTRIETKSPDRIFISCYSLNQNRHHYGKYLVILKNPTAFLNRIEDSLLKMQTKYGSVSYYPENHESFKPISQPDKPIWMYKKDNFSPDEEFRITINLENIELTLKNFIGDIPVSPETPIKFAVGDIRSIAELV